MSNQNDGNAGIDIPPELLITNFDDPIGAIVQSTYPNLLSQYQNGQYFQSRAILASTDEAVDQINDYVLKLVPGEEREYYSADSIDNSENNALFDMITPEFLNILKTSDIPNHKLNLKVGRPITLLTDFDPAGDLYKGTRLIVTRLSRVGICSLVAKRMSGENIDEPVFIHRIDMSPSRSQFPFKLVRRQFPISVSYAMPLQQPQGQSLDSAGLYLPRSFIRHDQLKVAFSSVKTKNGLKILIQGNDRDTINVINAAFKEVFENLNNREDLRAFLDELSNATPETSIKVRVARMWDTLHLNKQKGLISTDMVLIDEKANYIHATTSRWDSPKIKTKLREGKVYVISKFEVSINRQRYAVVENNSLELRLPGDVTVIEEDCGDIEIPRHIFEFVDFDNLPKRNGKEVYSDVIGVVTCVNPIEERTTVNGQVDMMSLQLKNERGDVFKVTLWDEYVAIFNQTLKEQMYDAPKPNVAIFTSVTVKQYQGELYAQSSRSTKIYINIDIPEVDDLIQSFRGDANIANASPTVNYAVMATSGISQDNP